MQESSPSSSLYSPAEQTPGPVRQWPIPEVDLTQSPESAAADQLVHALTTVGFCYAVGHGIPRGAVADVFAESAGFFALPMPGKLRYRRDWRRESCGYIPPHWAVTGTAGEPPVERFSLDAPPDEKEALDVCHACEAWPSDAARRACLCLIAAAQGLTLRLLRLLELGLGLGPPGRLTEAFGGFATPANTSQLRLLHYPPLAAGTGVTGDRCGEHTDYGCLTLVFCDSQPGLQVLSRSGQYLDANVEPGQVLVNIGDLMHRWTGGRLRSARHRVVTPTEPELRSRPRYSLVYFAHCDDEYVVRPVLGRPDSFPPVRTGDHFSRRFLETFEMGKGVDPELATSDGD